MTHLRCRSASTQLPAGEAGSWAASESMACALCCALGGEECGSTEPELKDTQRTCCPRRKAADIAPSARSSGRDRRPHNRAATIGLPTTPAPTLPGPTKRTHRRRSEQRWRNHRTAPPTSQVYRQPLHLSLIHISEPTRQAEISYAVFCLKKKKPKTQKTTT